MMTTYRSDTNRSRILHHLENYGSISSMEAFACYGETRLSASIFALKDRGYPIRMVWVDGVNRYGNKTRYGRYYLEV